MNEANRSCFGCDAPFLGPEVKELLRAQAWCRAYNCRFRIERLVANCSLVHFEPNCGKTWGARGLACNADWVRFLRMYTCCLDTTSTKCRVCCLPTGALPQQMQVKRADCTEGSARRVAIESARCMQARFYPPSSRSLSAPEKISEYLLRLPPVAFRRSERSGNRPIRGPYASLCAPRPPLRVLPVQRPDHLRPRPPGPGR